MDYSGHYLVLVWESALASHVTVTPYGDYYDPVETDFGDGTLQVFETFTNFMVCISLYLAGKFFSQII